MFIKYYRYVVIGNYPENPFKDIEFGRFKTEDEANERLFEVLHHIKKGMKARVEHKQFVFYKK